MSVEDIIKTHNYNDDIANYLRKSYSYFIEEFGNETIVYESLMNTPIYLTNNVYKCLKEHGFLNRDDNELVTYDDLKVSAGAYHSEPIIEYNKTANRYTLLGVNRIVAVNGNSLLVDKTKSMLTHEISHLIKSYYNEYTINNDTLVERSGLITKVYQLSNEDGRVKSTIWSESGVGFEEGLNAMQEESIMTKINRQPFFTKGYQTTKALIMKVINAYNIPKLKEIFKEAEMYHDNARIDTVLGQVYYDLLSFADKIYKLNKEQLNMNTTDARRAEIDKEVKELLINEYTPIHEQLKSIGQSSMAM